jgi:hypothetical protein
VHDFSTEDSSTTTTSSCQQPGADCKTVVSSGSAAGEVITPMHIFNEKEQSAQKKHKM